MYMNVIWQLSSKKKKKTTQNEKNKLNLNKNEILKSYIYILNILVFRASLVLHLLTNNYVCRKVGLQNNIKYANKMCTKLYQNVT